MCWKHLVHVWFNTICTYFSSVWFLFIDFVVHNIYFCKKRVIQSEKIATNNFTNHWENFNFVCKREEDFRIHLLYFKKDTYLHKISLKYCLLIASTLYCTHIAIITSNFLLCLATTKIKWPNQQLWREVSPMPKLVIRMFYIQWIY